MYAITGITGKAEIRDNGTHVDVTASSGDTSAARFDLESQTGFLGQALLEASGLDGPKLAVEIGVEKQLVLEGEGHGASAMIASVSRRRARASLDMTVPIGSAATSAMVR